VDTRVEIDHFHPFPLPRPTATPPTPTQRSGGRREDEKIMDNLLKLHEQLDKLSLEIEKKPTVEKQVGQLEDQLYRKMEEVVDKVARMETRDLERENRRITHEKEQAARRYNASVKSVESIGKDLADFKVAP
jgi:capsule polysaccharide export protein KpsE/RkpR